MSFLAPLFFLGALAIGLPILFHFIRRTTRERKPFSSLMFLLASPPRLTQRSKIENLLLLCLRCAVICLLAFAFARPFLRHLMPPAPAAAGKRTLLLVDVSASMRRSGLWADAQNRVKTILQKAGPGDQIALYTFDRQTRSLFSFEQWNASALGERAQLLLRKLSETVPGWEATRLANALIQAADTLADSAGKKSPEPGRIELITDLQEGAHLDQLQGYDWPKSVELSVNVLKPRTVSNASLQLVSDSQNTDNNRAGNVRVRISNLAGSRREQFKVGWGSAARSGFADGATEVYVPAGQSRIVSIAAPAKPNLDRLLLQGDEEDFDNTVFATPPAAVHLNVLYLGEDSESDPKGALYFLKRAFQPTPSQVIEVFAHRPDQIIPSAETEKSCLFVLTSPPSEQAMNALLEQVRLGKTLLLAADSPALSATVGRALGLGNVQLESVKPPTYGMLGEIDFRHPIFEAFADPRFSDFTKIHFWQYVRLNPATLSGARVLARFDTGDPALIESPMGAGKVLLLTTSWRPESSQLALSSKFVPLIYSLVENSGAPAPPPLQYHVGDVARLDTSSKDAKEPGHLVLPDGKTVELALGETNFNQTSAPGLYTWSSNGRVRKFAVNLDPDESRTSPLALEELERFGLPTLKSTENSAGEAQRKGRLQNNELENRQKLWRWFILVTMLLLVIETWLAGRTARRVAAGRSPVPA